MPAMFSYANILHAVGQVLDQIGVKSIAIHEEEDGLFVEGFNSDGQLQVQMRYNITSLYELVSGNEGSVEKGSTKVKINKNNEHDRSRHKGELVGASR